MSAVIAPTDKMKDVLKRTTSEAKSAVNKVCMYVCNVYYVCNVCIVCNMCRVR